jgi:hypothetical protein
LPAAPGSTLRSAAERFHRDFYTAALDPLGSLPLDRIPGQPHPLPLGYRIEDAKRRINTAMRALGGGATVAGSCAWHVVGEDRSLRKWHGLGDRGVTRQAATGVLVGPA